jgi:DNA-directed RNA polymerase sigma subunit (sigma70/sigma32)
LDSTLEHDVEFAYEDPWQMVRRALNVVSLDAAGGDVEDPNGSYADDEPDSQEPNRAAEIAAIADIFHNVLTKQEQFVLRHRLVGVTYPFIAENSRPRLRDASRARKIEQRALRKLRERLSRFRKHLPPKLDKSDL